MTSTPSDKPLYSGGQLIVRALARHTVQRVFCVPGESYLPVLDALHDSSIHTTVCRHEGGASMMAEATGKLEGKPGICMVTRGPGATNACAGLHVALQDSTPMILFIGQIGTPLREREAFQEVDYRRFLGSSVKWVAEIDSTARIGEMVSRAFFTASSGRPGPVALALPETTLSAMATEVDVPAWSQVETHPGPADMHTVSQWLQEASRPMVILGGSRWSASTVRQMQSIAQAWHLPVCCSFRRQMLFDHTHPHYAGDVGIGINPHLAQRIKDSDLIVLLGGRMSEIPSQGYTLMDVPDVKQRLVHVYPGAEELGRIYSPALAVNASPTAFVSAMSDMAAPTAIDTRRMTDVNQCHADYRAWSSPELHTPGKVQMSQIIKCLAEKLPDDAILTNGAGNYASWVHRFWKFRHYGSQLAPTSGTMGYGLPAAIAAKLHQPERCVVAFAGDGCLQMTVQEIATAMQYQANIIMIVVDNGIYGTIRMHQEQHFPGRVIGTDLLNPDFAALARAYGAIGLTVEQTEHFEAALSQALLADRPVLIHLKTSPDAITPTTTLTAIRRAGQTS